MALQNNNTQLNEKLQDFQATMDRLESEQIEILEQIRMKYEK